MSGELKKLIRNVPDFPQPGIIFRDITPLLADAQALSLATRRMAEPFRRLKVDRVLGAESRGFIFGALVARELNCGFAPIRKPGKLPGKTISAQYQLEYGADKLQIHTDAFQTGQKILMVDDLLATGGTMAASCQMVEKLGGNIVGISFLIELIFLKGRQKLGNYTIHSLISYDSE